MKMNPGTTPPTQGELINSVMISLPTNRTSTMVGGSQVTNRQSRSSSYHQMNNQVIYWDAKFKTLPPTLTGSQAEWDAAAAALGNIQLCGCSESGLTGQKLYRAMNLFAGMIGAPPFTSPPDPALRDGQIVIQVEDIVPDPPPLPRIQIIVTTSGRDRYVILNDGQGLSNTVWLVPGAFSDIILHPGDQGYGSLHAVPAGQLVSFCTYDDLGFPGANSHVPMLRF